MTICDYVSSRTARLNASFFNNLYFLNGKSYTIEEFNSEFPIDEGRLMTDHEVKHIKGENKDVTKNFIKNIKSY